MNLHEYQAKELLSSYNVNVPTGVCIEDSDSLVRAINKLNLKKWVIKAQVHSGARGKAGGVLLSDDIEKSIAFVKSKIGTNLITHQTGNKGLPINSFLLENASVIKKELYLSFIINRETQKISIVASCSGGTDIESMVADNPDAAMQIDIEQNIGISPYHLRKLVFFLKLEKKHIKQLDSLIKNLYRLFTDKDLSQLEINPLVINDKDELVCLDAKMNIDDNALYRQIEIANKHDKSQEDASEIEARKWDLSYISLDGNIGCMVNGAGLAMATLDLVKMHGGEPANFLDVGGGTTTERVACALQIILRDKNVKVIFINIFGGIVRCDLIAQGICDAASKITNIVPLVVRLEGNMAKEAMTILKRSPLQIIISNSLTDAAKKSVELAR
jgi:succinyl-CoA synthetase beta subunit